MTIAHYAKFIVAVAGLAAQAVNEGLVHGTAAHWVAIILAALTAAGVVATPNVPVVQPASVSSTLPVVGGSPPNS